MRAVGMEANRDHVEFEFIIFKNLRGLFLVVEVACYDSHSLRM